jgi:hypothetical protein
MVLKRVGVMSCAKISGAMYALIGLIAGAIFALFSLVGAGFAAAAAESSSPLLGMLFGVGAIIILPLFYGAIGFVGGLISAALYNWLAGIVGGIELELQ